MADERDPLLAAFRRVVRHLTHQVAYGVRYAGRIVEQNAASLLVGVVTDSPDAGDQQGVPMRLGLPGFKAKVPAGTRCGLEFDDGDPTKPVVTTFDQGSPVTELVFADGTKGAARVDDSVGCGTLTGVAPAGGGAVTFTWTPPGGGTPVTGTSLAIVGKITGGSSKLKVGG